MNPAGTYGVSRRSWDRRGQRGAAGPAASLPQGPAASLPQGPAASLPQGPAASLPQGPARARGTTAM